MRFLVFFAFFPFVLSDVPEHSLPDVKPVDLSSRCFCSSTDDPSKSPVIMLHGIIYSQRTWLSIYEDIALKTRRMVCMLDARNHGLSPWSDVFTFDALAVDLNHFMDMHNISRAILIGHSMGGLTAMKLALAKPEKVEKLIVEDISPRPFSEEVVYGIIFTFKMMKQSLKIISDGSDSKSAKLSVRNYIRNRLPPDYKRFYINDEEIETLPLVFENGVFRWQTNFDVLNKAFENQDTLMKPFSGQFDGDSLFIYGAKSPFKVYDDKDIILKLFPNAQFYEVEGASHVIHGRYPEYLLAVEKFVND